MRKQNEISIQMKLTLAVVAILIFASTLSVVVVLPFVSKSVDENVRMQMVGTTNMLSTLSKNSDFTIDEIISFNNSEAIKLTKYNYAYESGIYVGEEEQETLSRGEAIYSINATSGRFSALLKIRDNYVLVEGISAAENIEMIRLAMLFQMLVSAIVGIVLMLIVVTKMLKPIKNLSKATKEVARGNFNVTVEYKGHDEIASLAKNFNLMTTELQKMEFMRKDFVSNVSHEFKTPIASIQGFANLLKKPGLSEEQSREYAEIIADEASRLGNLTANILRLSHLENQVLPQRPVKFLLDEQIRKAILLLQSEWEPKNIGFNLHLDKISFVGDEELIQQIWINIIGNAIKFTDDGGEIMVLLIAIDDNIVIQIADNGIGIPPDKQGRIFEQFYQADPSRSNKGNGLGLAIVKKIVDQCKGTIGFESAVGKGTKFTITLPKKTY